MEMPFDVLNHRLGKIRDNGDIDFDNTDAAASIDEELQSKFLFFPIAELEDADIKESRDGHGFYVGDGPELCKAGEGENPNWLLNHARNALTLYWHLKERERLEEEQEQIEENRRRLLIQRPAPGVYLGYDGECNFTAIVTEDRRVLVPQENSSRTILDCSDDYDKAGPDAWDFQRVDITDGTVSA